MSSSPSLRKRGGKKEDSPAPVDRSFAPSSSQLRAAPPRSSEWDYRLAITILTVLAFITRFYKISYPDQVVFDEVHFGKVFREPCTFRGEGCVADALACPLVRFLLSTTDLLFRRSPPVRQTPARIHRVVGGL